MKSILPVLFLFLTKNILCQPTTDENELHYMGQYYGSLQQELLYQQTLCCQEVESQKIYVEKLGTNFTEQLKKYQKDSRNFIDHVANNFTNQFRNAQKDDKESIDEMTSNFTKQLRNVEKVNRHLINQMANNCTTEVDSLRAEVLQQKKTIDALKEISNNQTLKEVEKDAKYKDTLDQIIHNYTLEFASLKEILLEQKNRINTLEEISSNQSLQIKTLQDENNKYTFHQDCSSLFKSGYTTSGVYTIHIPSIPHPVVVYCDMQNGGGGWTVFQRRLNGNVSFEQPWSAYKSGFGNVTGEFWLGNDILSTITGHGKSEYKLRVELTKFSDEQGFAEYGNFRIGNQSENYRLTVGHYTGTVGDNGQGMSSNNNCLFTTFDRDNDGHDSNCADLNGYYGGGWWYTPSCGHVNLNGPYSHVRRRSVGDDIFWAAFDGFYSLMRTEMKFRPMDF